MCLIWLFLLPQVIGSKIFFERKYQLKGFGKFDEFWHMFNNMFNFFESLTIFLMKNPSHIYSSFSFFVEFYFEKM